ncbi:hypothetical protein M3147_04965 [Agromyces mediolanus]|uniref:hypothetical protein n=1 Tax=Agromyces mediolanus TaxID=41986 RepID=UPI002041C651|nr:hypothetical protein [Agromyces mediolanus]MCM3656599.1 hypothetical protein [Agromyces mediolanus]
MIRVLRDSEEWDSPHLELLQSNILEQLDAENMLCDLGLEADALERLAWALTANIQYAFDVRWAPKWVPKGSPHIWGQWDQTFARCNECLAESPALASENQAKAWFSSHRVIHENTE